MSDDQIADLRKRHDDAASIGTIIYGPHLTPSWTLVGWEAHHDRAFLLLELDRVSAENERLTRERDESRAEVTRLCDDIEHLLSLSLRP